MIIVTIDSFNIKVIMKALPAIMLLCLLDSAAAFGDMYIWTDARGIKHFSDIAPEGDTQYRQEKMVEGDNSSNCRTKNAGAEAQTPDTVFSSRTSKKNTPPSHSRTLLRLAKKQTRLRELEGQMDAYHEEASEKKRELEECRSRLERTKNESYQNYAAHERRVQQWEDRVERAQQRLVTAEDKLDRLYDKISTLEADINRLK